MWIKAGQPFEYNSTLENTFPHYYLTSLFCCTTTLNIFYMHASCSLHYWQLKHLHKNFKSTTPNYLHKNLKSIPPYFSTLSSHFVIILWYTCQFFQLNTPCVIQVRSATCFSVFTFSATIITVIQVMVL